MNSKLKVVLKEKGLKQGFVAEKAKVSKTAFSLIVNGRSVPSLPVAIRIARVLEETVEDLWGDLVQ